MPTPRNALAFLVLPLALAAAPWTADVGFRPPEDSKVTRDYAIDFDFELGDLTVIADGQDMSEMVPGDFEGSARLSMQTKDHFVLAGGGRALDLIRSYVSVEASMEAAGETQDLDESNDLEGKSVRFVWNEDEDDYDVSFHECEGEQSTLESLGADMDLSALLPDKAVSAGDVWSIPAEEFGEVLFFGANLGGDDDAGDDMPEMLRQELEAQFDALIQEFKVSCEYQGERDEGGVQVGVIAVTLTGEGDLDLEPVVRAAMDAQELPIEVDISFDTATLSISFEGKGELLWNLERGVLHAFDMGADVELVADLDLGIDAEGESHEMQAEAELLGRGTWKVRTATGD